MDTVRRYSMLIDGDWVDTDDRFASATEDWASAGVWSTDNQRALDVAWASSRPGTVWVNDWHMVNAA